jgi:hypothetical protein
MQQLHANRGAPTTRSNTQQPLRSMNSFTLGDRHFDHLQYLPLTPETDGDKPLYDDNNDFKYQGNDQDLSL